VLFANVAIPTLIPHWIGAFIVLVPVVVLEATVTKKRLQLPFAVAFSVCRRANVKSTLIGIPLAYVVSFFLVMPLAGFIQQLTKLTFGTVFGSIFFIGGFIDAPPGWLAGLATFLLLVPYYYVSVLIEKQSLEQSLPSIDPAQIRANAIVMNRASYIALGLLYLLMIYLFEAPMASVPQSPGSESQTRTSVRISAD
jgi:hypothetical protein